MPLARTTHEAIDAVEEFSFLMLDGEKLVRIDVHRRLLEDITGLRSRSSAAYLAALEEHRGRLEQIASAKYDSGDYLRYANSSVVPITKTDWTRSRPVEALVS